MTCKNVNTFEQHAIALTGSKVNRCDGWHAIIYQQPVELFIVVATNDIKRGGIEDRRPICRNTCGVENKCVINCGDTGENIATANGTRHRIEVYAAIAENDSGTSHQRVGPVDNAVAIHVEIHPAT